jgi:hypothetical protein
MEDSVVTRRKNLPRLELRFRSFKLLAEEAEAIGVVRWPVRLVIVAIAICLVVVAFNFHPISWDSRWFSG